MVEETLGPIQVIGSVTNDTLRICRSQTAQRFCNVGVIARLLADLDGLQQVPDGILKIFAAVSLRIP